MENKASITALMSAFGRIYHAEHDPNPVFSDLLSKKLLSPEEYDSIRGYVIGGLDFFAPERKGTFADEGEALLYLVNTHLSPTPLCRAAYCEKAILTALRTGTEQVVILGAGLDSFAFRHPELKCPIFEVDHPLTQRDKLARIERAGWGIPKNLSFVPVDFTKNNLKESLLAAGFDPGKKTFFSWLGVSYYLSVDAIRETLQSLAVLCAEGSTLVFDYADAGLFFAEEKRVQNMVSMAKAGGEEMKSSFDYLYLDSLLAEYGFLVYEVLEPEDIQAQIIDPVGSSLKAFEHINYILAVYKPK